jgi:hypothetical protein
MLDRFNMQIVGYAVAMLLISATVLSATANSLEQLERARAAFLCGWHETHAPSGNPKPLEFCQRADVPIDTLHRQVADWWVYWSDREDRFTANALEKGFEDDWRQLRQQQQAEAESSDEKELSRDIHKETVTDLCDIYRARAVGAELAYAELKRRKTFNATELGLIREHKIQIGMSERALICSWGNSEVNDTVTQYNVHRQYVYFDNTFVYVDDGRVTAYQSRTATN